MCQINPVKSHIIGRIIANKFSLITMHLSIQTQFNKFRCMCVHCAYRNDKSILKNIKYSHQQSKYQVLFPLMLLQQMRLLQLIFSQSCRKKKKHFLVHWKPHLFRSCPQFVSWAAEIYWSLGHGSLHLSQPRLFSFSCQQLSASLKPLQSSNSNQKYVESNGYWRCCQPLLQYYHFCCRYYDRQRLLLLWPFLKTKQASV